MRKDIMVHIRWAFNFSAWNPTRSEWTFCNQCIQNEERERIKKFYFKKDAKAAMVNVFLLVKLKSSLRKFYGLHHDLVDCYGISVSQMTTDMFHLS